MANRDYVLSATLELKDKLTGKLNDARKSLEGVKGSAAAASSALDGVGTSAVKAAADAGRLKSTLSGVKGTYLATVGVKDEASPTIRKVNREIRDISIHGNNITLTVTAEDKVSPALSKAKSGLQSVKGNYSTTLSVKDMASGKLNAIKSSVRELAGRASAVTVRARDEATAKLTRIREELAGLAGKTYTAMVNVKQNGGLSKMKESMSGFAGGMLMNTSVQMAGAAGIGYGVYDTVKTSMDFDAALSGVKALVPAGEDATRVMEAVRQKAMELGQETAFGDTDVAKGMTELLKAGIDFQSVMGDATKAALDLAVVGGLELPEAAKIMSTAMNAFKVTDATHAADTLSGAANASATNVHEMSYAMSACASVAAGMGVSFEDTSATLALFAKNGLLGSDAGTSLKTMLSRLVPSTDQAADEFRRLGLMTADGKNKFFDAKGNMKSMADVAGILQDALKGMTAEQRQATLSTLFGSDAIRGAIILSEKGANGFNDMTEAMTRFTAAGSAATMRDNLKGDIEELSGAWENFQVTLMSGKATSGLRGLVKELGGIVKFMTERIKDGLDFGDIFALAGKGITDLKNKFIEFDGVGSILAGGALAAGLYKIISIAGKARDAVRDAMRGSKGGIGGTKGGASGVSKMVVNAGSVVVNGKGVQGGAGGAGEAGERGGANPRTGTPSWKDRLSASKGVLAEGAIVSAVIAAAGVYTAKQEIEEASYDAMAVVRAAQSRVAALKTDGGTAGEWKAAIADLQEAKRYDAQTQHDNAVRNGEAWGSATGTMIGTVAGGVLGTFFGPVGTMIGMTAGGMIGEIAGSKIGAAIMDYNPMSGFNYQDETFLKLMQDGLFRGTGYKVGENGEVVPVSIESSSADLFKDIKFGYDYSETTPSDFSFSNELDLNHNYTPAFESKPLPEVTAMAQPSYLHSDLMDNQPYTGLADIAEESNQRIVDSFVHANAQVASDWNATNTAMQLDTGTTVEGVETAWGTFPGFFEGSVTSPVETSSMDCNSSVTQDFQNSASASQSAWAGVGAFFSGLWGEIKSGAASCAASVAQSMASAAASARAGGHTTIADGLDWIGNNAAWFGGVEYPHYAIGTSFAPGGWTEINEHGGEIVDLPTGSRVYPHATTLSMLKDTFENNLPTAIPVSAPNISVDLPRAQSDAGTAQVVITGNSFIVREEADMDKIAYKLLALMQESRANMNPVEGVLA